MNLPTLNMVGWDIDDYEDAYNYLQAMIVVGERSIGQSTAGSAFVASLIENWMDWQVTEIIASLVAARFDSRAEESSRIRLLMRHALASSDASPSDICSMMHDQQAGA